jgi:hypothetical protein
MPIISAKFPWGDDRFSPGYTWCSDDDDCRRGLCMAETDPAKAAERYVANDRTWHNRGRIVTVWTLADPTASPQKHTITL